MKELLRVSTLKWILLALLLSAFMLKAHFATGSSARLVEFPENPSTNSGSLTAMPEILHFKNVAIGQTVRRRVTLQNSSRATLVVSAVHKNEPNFRVLGIQLPLKIVAGGSVSLEIAFTPNRKRNFQSDFEFKTGTGQTMVQVDGRGTAERQAGLASNPRDLNFGSVGIGQRAERRITLINSGATDQTVQNLTSSGKEFGFTGLNFPFTLTPGESITFDVFFVPARIAPVTEKMMVEAADYDLPIAITGKGRQPGQVAITPGNLNFGNVNVGVSTTLTGTLRAGAAAVTIYSAGLTSSEFALNGLSFPQTIAAHHSKTYSVTFQPRSAGGILAALSFQTSAAKSLIQQALLGTGASSPPPAPALHRVTLSWNSAGQEVIGYNVYRAATSGGPYTKLNPVADSNTSYLDSTVLGGHTYFYVTTAIASNGAQSGFSNQVEVALP